MAEDKKSAISHGKLVGKLSVVVFAMFGFGFALVPMYDMICDAFGLNGRFVEIEQGTFGAEQGQIKGRQLATRRDTNRTITVQFTATLNQSMAWEFEPLTRSMELHPGEIKQVKYLAHNKTGKKVVAQAVPSVAPGQATKYFTKMECFCFDQQTFEPGETKEMQLVFVVDPDLPRNVNTITLGYTFFDTDRKAGLESDEKIIMAAAESSKAYLN